MPLSKTVEGLQKSVKELAHTSLQAVVYVSNRAGQVLIPVVRTGAVLVNKVLQSKVMKEVGNASVKVFKGTVVSFGEGFGNAAIEFGALGFAPLDNYEQCAKHYKDNFSVNPFYLVGSVAGAAIATPITVTARLVVDVGTGVAMGFVEAFSTGRSIKEDMQAVYKEGRYLALPMFALSYATFKPIEFTAKQLRDGVVRGWNVDLKGFSDDIKKEPNVLMLVPLVLVNTTGLALGLSAKAVKYPVQHTVAGLVDGAAVMIDYHRFKHKDFVGKSLYKETDSNIIHNVAMLPGAVAGLALGQGGSILVGTVYGFGNGVIAGANFSRIDKPLEVKDDLRPHQAVVMAPALVTYTAGVAAGFAVSLVTKPIHSKQNFKNTLTVLAMPVVAPYHYGKELYAYLNKATSSNDVSLSRLESVDSITVSPVVSPLLSGSLVAFSPVTLHAVSNDTVLSDRAPLSYLDSLLDSDMESDLGTEIESPSIRKVAI